MTDEEWQLERAKLKEEIYNDLLMEISMPMAAVWSNAHRQRIRLEEKLNTKEKANERSA